MCAAVVTFTFKLLGLAHKHFHDLHLSMPVTAAAMREKQSFVPRCFYIRLELSLPFYTTPTLHSPYSTLFTYCIFSQWLICLSLSISGFSRASSSRFSSGLCLCCWGNLPLSVLETGLSCTSAHTYKMLLNAHWTDGYRLWCNFIFISLFRQHLHFHSNKSRKWISTHLW